MALLRPHKGMKIARAPRVIPAHEPESKGRRDGVPASAGTTVGERPEPSAFMGNDSVNVEEGRTYVYRVKAINATGIGPWSNDVQITTGSSP